MGCLLDDLRVFGIDPDKWMIAAQDKEKWHWTALGLGLGLGLGLSLIHI